MNNVEEDDIFLEMLEVFINTILYIREVYPAGIFRRRKMYNTVVYVSIYPALNEYLVKILTTVQLLKKAKKLHKVELIIYKTENKNQLPCTETILEKFVFEVEASPTPISTKVGSTSMLDDRWTHDKYLIEFEEEIRKSLIQFDQIAKNLDRLVNCENVNFRIKLETTEAGFVELTHKMNSKEDNFPWAHESKYGRRLNKSWRVLPISTTHLCNIHMHINCVP